MAITHDHSYSDAGSVATGSSFKFKINRIESSAPITWLQKAWDDFYSIPGLSLLYGVFAVVTCYLLYLYSRESPVLLLGLVSGALLLGPFLAVGLYAAARDIEAGYPVSIRQSLKSISKVALRVGLMGLFLAIMLVAWLRVSFILVALHYAAFQPGSLQLALQQLDWSTLLVLLLYIGIGFLFAAIVFVTTAVALPMILDRGSDPVSAIVASVQAVNANRRPMLLWAGLIVAAAVVSVATGFVGFVILFPVLGYATWHGYRDLIAEP